MQRINYFIIGLISFASISFLSVNTTTSTDPFFYEYGGYDNEGNEITVLFLTKVGYDSLIVPTGNDTLVNFLLQLQENNNALKARIDDLEAGNTSSIITADIDMNGFRIINASEVQTELFSAKPVQ